MSYLSDEQIYELRSTRTTIADNPWFAYADAAMDVRDLYEAHLKEKEELLREAAGALEEVLGGSRVSLCDHLSHPLSGDRHKLGEPCRPTERIAALLSRINTHLTSNPT